MNVITTILRDYALIGKSIKLLKRSRSCVENNWNQLEDYISKSCKLISEEEFDRAFLNKKIFEHYPETISRSLLIDSFSGKWRSQPFGCQNPPDFIGFELFNNKMYVFYIECKSGKSDRATWNCTLPNPKAYAIYLFFNNGTQQLSVCSGIDLITKEEHQNLCDIMPTIRKQHEKINTEASGWNLYLRPKWTPTKKHPHNIYHIDEYIKKITNVSS
jgi:hypothetical protein